MTHRDRRPEPKKQQRIAARWEDAAKTFAADGDDAMAAACRELAHAARVEGR
jgi:hypothetical protein